jgi:hypothetical protein
MDFGMNYVAGRTYQPRLSDIKIERCNFLPRDTFILKMGDRLFASARTIHSIFVHYVAKDCQWAVDQAAYDLAKQGKIRKAWLKP